MLTGCGADPAEKVPKFGVFEHETEELRLKRINFGTNERHRWFATSVSSALGENKGFAVGSVAHASLNVAGCTLFGGYFSWKLC